MAAIVTGLIPILRTAADATTSYKGRSLWFSFLCVRLVILFLAELPFAKLDADFTCNGTAGAICSRACFNRHFHRPMVMAWNFVFVLVIASVITLRVAAEAWFLYVLLCWNLPALDSGPYQCLTDVCPELHVCVVRAAPEKRMSIYALSSVSGTFIVCSVFFCTCSIAHYLLRL